MTAGQGTATTGEGQGRFLPRGPRVRFRLPVPGVIRQLVLRPQPSGVFKLSPVQREVLVVRDLGDGYVLRHALWRDHAALKRICLLTGDAGKDASAREDDPDLLGLIYAVPYQVFAHEFSFVIDGPEGVVGYVLGAPDSAAYYETVRTSWFPDIAKGLRDPGPDASVWQGSDWARHYIHHPSFTYPGALHAYPAHGHIDLLPEIQGRGFGRQALTALMEALRAAGVPGLHLGVNPTNAAALGFYERLGFRPFTHPDLPERTVYMVTAL